MANRDVTSSARYRSSDGQSEEALHAGDVRGSGRAIERGSEQVATARIQSE